MARPLQGLSSSALQRAHTRLQIGAREFSSAAPPGVVGLIFAEKSCAALPRQFERALIDAALLSIYSRRGFSTGKLPPRLSVGGSSSPGAPRGRRRPWPRGARGTRSQVHGRCVQHAAAPRAAGRHECQCRGNHANEVPTESFAVPAASRGPPSPGPRVWCLLSMRTTMIKRKRLYIW